MPYAKYLQCVLVILPTGFSDNNEPHIQDVLLRYQTLSETNQDLRARLSQLSSALDASQTHLLTIMSQNVEQIVMLNAELSKYQKRLEKVTHRHAN